VPYDRPWCRATIHRGRITLNPWRPVLIRGGPAAMALEPLAAHDVAVADLHLPAEGELEVRFVPGSPRPPGTADAILAWAANVGFMRVWLPDRVADVEPDAEPLGCAEVRCPTCGLGWHDDSPDFWAAVHAARSFPGWCAACGGSLPEWHNAGRAHGGDPPAACGRVARS